MVEGIPSTTREKSLWLRVGALLDGSSTAPQRDAHVVYNGAGIRFVGSGGRTPPRELLREGQTKADVDAPDCTLLPGLIEAHAHLFLEGGELGLEKRAAYIKQSPAELLAAARERLAKLVRLGIAGVRDAGDRDGVGLALSKLCASPGRPLMPYVESPGAAIYHRGRYGSFMGDPLEDYPSPHDCVEARVKAGADRIKLIPTGIINFKKGQVTTEPQMTTAEIIQLVAAVQNHPAGRPLQHGLGRHRHRPRDRGGGRRFDRARVLHARRPTRARLQAADRLGADVCPRSGAGRSRGPDGMGRVDCREPEAHS